MAQNILKASEVNVSDLKFSPPKKLPMGGNKVYVNTDSGSLYVQTPKVNVLWDTKFYQGDNEGCGNYPVEFSLSDLQNNPTMKSFYDMLVSFDEHLVELAYQNRKDWFGPKLAKANKDTIQSLYTPMVKVSLDKETGEPNGKYPPRFGLKISMWDGVHQCKVYDENKNLFNIDNKDEDDFKSLKDDILVKGAGINVLLRCHGIWIISGKFGCTWRAEQIKVKVPEKSINGYAFRDDDDEDVEDMDVVENNSEPDIVDSDSDNDNDDDDDDDDDDEEEVVEEVKPAHKKVVKKRVVKKQ